MRFAAPAVLLLVIAALVAGCGGGGTTTVVEKTVTVESGGGGETTADDEGASGGEGSGGGQAEDKIEAPTAVVHLESFRSPSGNIGCVMYEGGARCDIRKREWSPPERPANCPEQVDFGQGLTVSHTGKASFVCAGDTALDPSAAQLAYGEASELGGTQCISRSTGVTCANHSGHGFFISAQSYKLF